MVTFGLSMVHILLGYILSQTTYWPVKGPNIGPYASGLLLAYHVIGPTKAQLDLSLLMARHTSRPIMG